MIVDLPQPDSPTIATVRHAGTVKERPLSTGTSGRAGYAKSTLEISTLPYTLSAKSELLRGPNDGVFKSEEAPRIL